MSDGEIEKHYKVITAKLDRIKDLLEEKKSLKPVFLENTAEKKRFSDKIDEIIDNFCKDKEETLKIMGYFDNSKIEVLSADAYRIKVICFDKKNLHKNIIAGLKKLYQNGAEIRTNDELHARIIITNNSVIVGSVDLEADCLLGNRIDACIFSDNPDVVKDAHTFFEDIWDKSSRFFSDPRMIFYEDYSSYKLDETLDDRKNKWIVNLDEGEIKIKKDVTLNSNNNKCIRIFGTKKTHIQYKFKDTRKITLDYYIKRENYNNLEIGTPFILESAYSITRGNEKYDTRAFYMEISKGKLMTFNENYNKLEYESICELEEKKWYHIILEINCDKHDYTCSINGKTYNGIVPNAFTSINSIRTKFNFGENRWVTYLGPIILKGND